MWKLNFGYHLNNVILTIKIWQLNLGCWMFIQDWVDEEQRRGLGSWSLMEIGNVNCFVRQGGLSPKPIMANKI
jgi:hypothetical protein